MNFSLYQGNVLAGASGIGAVHRFQNDSNDVGCGFSGFDEKKRSRERATVDFADEANLDDNADRIM
jgi:hypothetical protein